MPACQSEKSVFIALFSRTDVLGRAMHSPVGHPAFLPSASQSRRWKQRATDCKNRDFQRYRAVFGRGGVNGIPRRAC